MADTVQLGYSQDSAKYAAQVAKYQQLRKGK